MSALETADPTTSHSQRRPPTERFTDWRQIGKGGTSNVYQVHDHELGIDLAIKVLHPTSRSDDLWLNSLRNEVLISRALRHPNICPIHDLYEGEKGVGIVMDLVKGIELKEWLKENNDRLLDTIEQRITLLTKLCDALQIAHQQITHRDLKPANIFLKNGAIDAPIIMDFGLARASADIADGLSGGTPKYMPPEQFTNEGVVDQKSDLYALGVIAYEVLTGGRIPETSLQDVVKTRKLPDFNGTVITPPSRYCSALPAAMDRLVLSMLDYEPRNRPTSATEVGEVIRSARLNDPSLARASSTVDIETASIDVRGCAVGSNLRSAMPAEKPERTIDLTPFRIGKTQVTNAMFDAFVSATGHRRPPKLSDERFNAPDAPVVMVSWDDAAAYAEWVGGRLPTEFEWEAACKASQRNAQFPWGNATPDSAYANIDGVCQTTTPVGSYVLGRNPIGLMDMCGNVWEWCQDSWDAEALTKMSDKNWSPDPAIPVKNIRGGSFDSLSTTGRCSFRSKAPADERRADIGFRVVFEDVV